MPKFFDEGIRLFTFLFSPLTSTQSITDDIFEGKIELFNPILLIMVELISLKFISPAQIGFIDRVILGGFNSHINEVKDQTFENIIGVV